MTNSLHLFHNQTVVTWACFTNTFYCNSPSQYFANAVCFTSYTIFDAIHNHHDSPTLIVAIHDHHVSLTRLLRFTNIFHRVLLLLIVAFH